MYANGCLQRITPAYAGKRLFRHPFSSLKRDHPRLCGEKQVFLRYGHMFLGSPPPMRGKGLKSVREVFRHRITPAYAGKSSMNE